MAYLEVCSFLLCYFLLQLSDLGQACHKASSFPSKVSPIINVGPSCPCPHANFLLLAPHVLTFWYVPSISAAAPQPHTNKFHLPAAPPSLSSSCSIISICSIQTSSTFPQLFLLLDSSLLHNDKLYLCNTPLPLPKSFIIFSQVPLNKSGHQLPNSRHPPPQLPKGCAYSLGTHHADSLPVCLLKSFLLTSGPFVCPPQALYPVLSMS